MSKNDQSSSKPTRIIRAGKTKKITSEDGGVVKAAAKTKPIPDYGKTLREPAKKEAAPAPKKKSAPRTIVVPSKAKGKDPDKTQHDKDPITGWLVITEGAGRGTSLKIGYGLHKIGRGEDQDICVNFGDDQISRSRHATIEYDPKTREFFVSKGDNLVYLNGKRVGSNSESEIATGDELELGDSKFRFVSFCGPDFDWAGDK